MDRLNRVPLWLLAVSIVAAIVVVLVGIATLGTDALPERTGPPVEDIQVERTEFRPGEIELTVRNAGPDPVVISQVTVNNAFTDFAGSGRRIDRLETEKLKIRYSWIEDSPYLVGLLTSTGLVVEHQIEAAVETPEADGDFFGTMALIGLYVGVIPVILGMLALPVLRRGGRSWTTALIAFTVGLLGFLAVDATLEALELSAAGSGVFGGEALVILCALLAFLALSAIDSWLKGRRRRSQEAGSSAWQLALMVAIGIGLHNFGEGLAIGSAYSVGELALGTSLIIGFAIHNTTEGLAIVAPLSNEKPRVPRLLGLGLIAGAPAIAGAVLGGSVTSDEVAAGLIGIGVGAIVQVIVQLTPSMKDATGRILTPVTSVGIAAGTLALYLTGFLIAA
jgi:ZIP family zinc transporter